MWGLFQCNSPGESGHLLPAGAQLLLRVHPVGRRQGGQGLHLQPHGRPR